MDWLKAIFGKNKENKGSGDESPGPMEKLALELCNTDHIEAVINWFNEELSSLNSLGARHKFS